MNKWKGEFKFYSDGEVFTLKNNITVAGLDFLLNAVTLGGSEKFSSFAFYKSGSLLGSFNINSFSRNVTAGSAHLKSSCVVNANALAQMPDVIKLLTNGSTVVAEKAIPGGSFDITKTVVVVRNDYFTV